MTKFQIGDKVSITQKAIETLREEEWLEDPIINPAVPLVFEVVGYPSPPSPCDVTLRMHDGSTLAFFNFEVVMQFSNKDR